MYFAAANQVSTLFSCFPQVPVPVIVPPQNKDMKDAAVQSEPLAVKEEKQKDKPVSSAGDAFLLILILKY